MQGARRRDVSTTKCCVKFANAINKLVSFACCGCRELRRGGWVVKEPRNGLFLAFFTLNQKCATCGSNGALLLPLCFASFFRLVFFLFCAPKASLKSMQIIFVQRLRLASYLIFSVSWRKGCESKLLKFACNTAREGTVGPWEGLRGCGRVNRRVRQTNLQHLRFVLSRRGVRCVCVCVCGVGLLIV